MTPRHSVSGASRPAGAASAFGCSATATASRRRNSAERLRRSGARTAADRLRGPPDLAAASRSCPGWRELWDGGQRATLVPGGESALARRASGDWSLAGLNRHVLVSASARPARPRSCKGCAPTASASVRLVGTDMSERSVGRHLCDAFHLVPAGSDPASPTRCSTSSSGRASTPSCRSRPSTSRGSPPTATASRCRCSSLRRTRSTAPTTRPRPTRCCSGSA